MKKGKPGIVAKTGRKITHVVSRPVLIEELPSHTRPPYGISSLTTSRDSWTAYVSGEDSSATRQSGKLARRYAGLSVGIDQETGRASVEYPRQWLRLAPMVDGGVFMDGSQFLMVGGLHVQPDDRIRLTPVVGEVDGRLKYGLTFHAEP